MKASELRVENIVSFGMSDNHIVNVGTIYNCINDKYKYRATPLTEEWLLKFGFVQSQFDKHSYVLGDFCFDISDNTFTHRSHWLSVIKHVHQLQNLYFALTGKELQSDL